MMSRLIIYASRLIIYETFRLIICESRLLIYEGRLIIYQSRLIIYEIRLLIYESRRIIFEIRLHNIWEQSIAFDISDHVCYYIFWAVCYQHIESRLLSLYDSRCLIYVIRVIIYESRRICNRWVLYINRAAEQTL